MRPLSLGLCSVLIAIVGLFDHNFSGNAAPKTLFSSLMQQDSKKKGEGSSSIRKGKEKPPEPAPRRTAKPRTTLLELEYRVLKLADDGLLVEPDPCAQIQRGDRVQLRIKPNQDGYLYVVHNTEDKNGKIVHSRVLFRDDQDFIDGDETLVVPSGCEKKNNQDGCWIEIKSLAGRDLVTIIFSREKHPRLIDELSGTGSLERIRERSNQNYRKTPMARCSQRNGGSDDRSVSVRNPDAKNDKELVELIQLTRCTADDQARSH